VKVKIYVEGGGDTRDLKTQCRQGFSEFFRKAGLEGHMPRIVAGGSRGRAFADFCTALKQAREGDFIVLLVDSEAAVRTLRNARRRVLPMEECPVPTAPSRCWYRGDTVFLP